MGLPKCFAQAKASGVDGIIVPDLPMEEADDHCTAAHAAKVDTVLLAAPTTTDKRLSQLADRTEGFLYLVSQLGVTGTQVKSGDLVAKSVGRALQFTKGKVPLAVGFGVSKPEQVKSLIGAGADGVIVGSAFVNIVAANQGNVEKMLTELEAAVRMLKAATK
jgi:tryptophan synthase alpha chain